MGDFLAVSAFRTEDATALAQAVASYLEAHGVTCKVREEASGAGEPTDAAIYGPENGWVRVLWPQYFNVHDFPLCGAISVQRQLVVSTVHVYDGDFWEHLFLNAGSVLHKFSSWPDYFAEDAEAAARAKTEWKGHSAALAAFLGLPADSFSRYFVHMPIDRPAVPPAPAKKSLFSWFQKREGASSTPPVTKAYDDDKFDLDNYWVFTDFWQRLGIKYPDPPNVGIIKVLRLDRRFGTKLPTS